MTIKPAFGRPMRSSQFDFAPTFTPLNHGSFGAYPRVIQDKQDAFQKQCHERPDTFIVYNLPNLIDDSRKAVAPLLGVETDEVVFVPNATTGVNTVLRNLKWETGDVIVHFSTIYHACKKTLSSIKEHEPLETVDILLEYPIQDAEIVRLFKETVGRVKGEGRNVRLAMFDTVLTFPGARMPWEELVEACKELEVLSLIDGAHGIGNIDLRHLGNAGPDFFVSNCHKYVSLLFQLKKEKKKRSRALNKITGGSTPLALAPSSTFHSDTNISFGPVYPPPTVTNTPLLILPQHRMGRHPSYISLNSSPPLITLLISASQQPWNSERKSAEAKKLSVRIASTLQEKVGKGRRIFWVRESWVKIFRGVG